MIQRIKDYKIISFVGNSKNAGKTTVINFIIKHILTNKIAITSIGLDGEDLDQVTNMEKPKVYVKEGYIIATAQETLKKFTAEYEVLNKTDIFTSIGKIYIVKIKKAGNALIAGPSVISDMEKVVQLLSKYKLDKIFIDGAFFRHSLAKIAEATVFIVGANLSSNMDRVVEDASLSVKKFSLEKPDFDADKFNNIDHVCMVDNLGKLKELPYKTIVGNTVNFFEGKKEKCRFLYLPTSLTNNFVKKLVEKRYDFDFDIILESPVSIQLDFNNTKNLFKLKNKVFVLNPINLVAVCYNPYSPRGYEFNDKDFRSELEKILNMEVYNVVKDVPNE